MYRFLRFPGFKYKALTLSYDDDVIFDKKLIEILDEYKIKCTFNLNSLLFKNEKNNTPNYLTKEEATLLFKNSPHEVAVHGAKHLSLAEVKSEIALKDVLTDRENLEKQFDRVIKGMAYANGSFNDEVVELLKKCGIKYSRTCMDNYNFDIPTDWLRMPATCHHNNKNLFELVDKFLSLKENEKYYWSNSPKLFYLWGHSYEFNNDNNWDLIIEFAKKMGNRDDIWYATNMEIYDYVNAYNNLEYSVDGNIIINNSNIDLYLCYYGKYILVKANSTYKIL